jgi:hypothetical protein
VLRPSCAAEARTAACTSSLHTAGASVLIMRTALATLLRGVCARVHGWMHGRGWGRPATPPGWVGGRHRAAASASLPATAPQAPLPAVPRWRPGGCREQAAASASDLATLAAPARAHLSRAMGSTASSMRRRTAWWRLASVSRTSMPILTTLGTLRARGGSRFGIAVAGVDVGAAGRACTGTGWAAAQGEDQVCSLRPAAGLRCAVHTC